MIRALHLACLLVLAPACFRAPDVVLIDRKTALEQLAAGTYRKLEAELETSASPPQPEALTRGEIEAASGAAALAADEADRGQAAQIDELLRHRCIGEALDGTVVITANTCQGRPDNAERSRVVEHANRERYQIWRELQTRGLAKGRERELSAVRAAWREAHLRAVVCGGQIQRSDGVWEDKKC